MIKHRGEFVESDPRSPSFPSQALDTSAPAALRHGRGGYTAASH